MKNLKIFTLVSLFLFISTTGEMFSQAYVSLHVGPSFPISDFASDNLNDEDAGGAAVGINVGLQYTYQLSESGLGLFGGIDFLYNGLQKDLKDEVKEMFEYLGIYNPDIKFYKYINIPISVGLNYTYQANDKLGLFANAGLAVDFLKITNMELRANGQKVITEMDLATSIGLKAGGGILIKNKAYISFHYYGFAKHNIKGEVRSSGYSEDIEGKGKVDLMTLSVGICF